MNLNRLFRTSLVCGPLFVAACGDDTSDVGDDGDGTTSGSATDTNGQVTLTTMPQTTDPTTDPDPDTTVGDTTIGEDDTTTGEDTDDTTTGVDPDGTTTGDTDGTTTGDTEDTEGETTGANGCAQITVSNFTPGAFVYPTTDVDPNIGGADPELFRFEFYSPATGSFDLAAGLNDNYATCDQCLRLFEDVTEDDIARQYFQQSGTIDIDASSDLGGGVLVATLTDVTLVEVTIDPDNAFESTPVPDGACVQINTQNVSVVPNNSCEGAMLCGEADPVPGSFPACYCDELCFVSGDCCPDVCEPNACGAEPFCDDAGDGCDPFSVDGVLDNNDPTFARPTAANNCTVSGTYTNVYYEVYTYELTGPGPHNLVASTCNAADFDTLLAVYQSPGGAADPFDPAAGCDNIVGFNDDGAGCGLTSSVTLNDLEAGIVQVVVTSFGNAQSGNFTLDISSTTCE